MPTLHLSEDINTIILNAARPIAPQHRDAFVLAVQNALRDGGETIGPGSVHRLIRIMQRSYFDAPNLDGDGDDPPHPRRRSTGKYARW
jgi:hypothetical protein